MGEGGDSVRDKVRRGTQEIGFVRPGRAFSGLGLLFLLLVFIRLLCFLQKTFLFYLSKFDWILYPQTKETYLFF
jgi:hypothetical protein